MTKTREQQLADRVAEIGWRQQMEAAHAAEAAERERAHNELMQRVQARRDAIDSFIKRSWAQRSSEPMSEREYNAVRSEIEQQALEQARLEGAIPTLDAIFAEDTARRAAEAEAAERARIAAIPPKENWRASLRATDREWVDKYEQIRKTPWPGTENMV